MNTDDTSDVSVADGRAGALEEVLAEYLLAAEAGAAPGRDAFVAAHPELAGELRAFFEDEERFNRLADPFRAAGAPPGAGETARCFGEYELLEELGRGGMGVVYKARHLRLNRVVARKMILSGQCASAEDVKRFQVEAENAARLDHPHIVPVYEVGRHRGRHYFTMKLVTGGSLARQVERFTTDHRAAARLVATSARAVHHAHQHGILHRDIKPGNILLDADGRPQVTDFGLARRLEGEDGLTLTGALLGSPRYMAPEQARGEKGLTVSADVYALGAVLYELLTGRPPFSGDTVLETLRQVREQEPARPSGIVRALDRDLETVCLKAMEKDPRARYASAEALQRDLEHWLRGEPLSARPAAPWERAVKWARRNPARAALGAVSATGMVVLIGVLLVGDVLLSRKQAQTDAALKGEQRASARAQTEAAKALAVGRFLREMLGSANPWDGLSRDVRVREVLDAAAARVDAGELRDQPEVEAEVRMTLARTYNGLAIYQPGNAQLTAALKTLRGLSGDHAAEVSDCLLMLAENLMGQEDHAGSEGAARQALAIRRETCRARDLRLAEALGGLGGVLRRRGRTAEAELLLNEGLSIVGDGVAGGAATVHRKLLEDLAHTVRRKGDYAAAEELFRQVLVIGERRYGRSHPTTAVTLSDVAYVLKETYRDAEAESMFREAIETLRTTLANDDPNVTGNADELIPLLVRRKRAADDGASLAQVLAQLLAEERARNGEGHPLVARMLESLAYWRRDTARDDAGAVAAFREALDAWRACAGDKSLGAGNVMMALAFTLHRLGRDDEVGPLYRRALAIRRTYYGDIHPDTIDTVRRLAEFLTDQGDYAAAEPLWLELHGWVHAHPRNKWQMSPRFAASEVASFYRRWDKPDRVAAWEAERDKAPSDSLSALQAQVAAFTAQLEQIGGDGAEVGAGAGAGPGVAGPVGWLRGERAGFHARMGRFPEAAADFARALRLDPANHLHWYAQAIVLAYLNRADEYSRHCAAMRERFTESGPVAVAARTAEACLLLPAGGGDPRDIRAALDRLAAVHGPGDAYLQERGIADYRCGDFDSAIARMRRVLAVQNQVEHRATAHLVAALSSHHLGAVADAASHMAEARRLIENDIAQAGRDDLYAVERWVLCHLFLREAEAAGPSPAR